MSIAKSVIGPAITAVVAQIAVLIAAQTVSVSCQSTSPADVLWVPANSTLEEDGMSPISIQNGRSLYVDGSAAVNFNLDANREELTTQLVTHFRKAGLRQRGRQYLNPQIPTSFDAGWEARCACVLWHDEEGKSIQRHFHKWHGEWEDRNGNVVTYDLSEEAGHVHGYAAWVPSRVVEESKRLKR